MGRPKSKSALLELGKANFEKLHLFIEQMDLAEQQRDFPQGTMNRNIRDVLMHLHHWHLMFADWYKVGMEGGKPHIPAAGYTWRTTPELNRWINEKYQSTSLLEAKQDLLSSYKFVRAIVKAHSEKELFEKKHYKWTGSTSLAAYLISATSSHYDWAFKLIKNAKK